MQNSDDGTKTVRLDIRSGDPRLIADAGSPKTWGFSKSLVDGRYSLIKKIGTGGFGEVWRAHDEVTRTLKAVKIIPRRIDGDGIDEEHRTLEVVTLVKHPYLLRTEAFFIEGDRLIVVMELADSSLREAQKLSLGRLLKSMKQAADALDYLHCLSIFHRDIKPENLLLVGDTVKVADFGLAKLAENSRSIKAGFAGSPAYSSPETWRGRVTSRSDQYSLAVTYAELRLGARLFKGPSIYDYMIGHTETLPDLETLPDPEKAVLMRALSKTPEKRFDSCSSFVTSLEAATAT